jgi:hypothetical protein
MRYLVPSPITRWSDETNKFRGKPGRIVPQRSFASVVILWNTAAIEAAGDDDSGSLVMVRALAMLHTAQVYVSGTETEKRLSIRAEKETDVEHLVNPVSKGLSQALA